MKVESAMAWFGIMGFSGLAGLIILFKLDIFSYVSEKNNRLGWQKLLSEQWFFGSWIVLAAFFNFAATQIQIFITAGMLGLEAAGAFRALQNFMLPMLQVVSAISTLALPSIAFAFGRGNYADMRRRGFFVAGALFVFSSFYFSFLFLFATPLENLLYAGRYKEYTWLMPIIGIIPLITALESGFSLIVRSLQRSIYYAVLTFGMAVAGIVSGLILIPSFGVAGAIGSLVASTMFSFIINIWFYRKWFSSIFSFGVT